MSKEDLPLPVTASHEPEWTQNARSCYRDVIHALQQAKIPFVVGGGFAFHKHTGIWRTTKDLDLVLVAGEVPRALEQLKKSGFETCIEDPIWLAKACRGEYYIDLITGAGNATLPAEESWIERSVPDEVLGIRCNVLPAEELIASKLFVTRRERFDGADIMHLIRVSGSKLDWDRLMRLTEPYWEMLYWYLVLFAFVYPMRTDVVPRHVWEDLSRKFMDHLNSNSQPFRGSLIDPKMFAIDVVEWGEPDLYRELCAKYPRLLSAASRSEE